MCLSLAMLGIDKHFSSFHTAECWEECKLSPLMAMVRVIDESSILTF